MTVSPDDTGPAFSAASVGGGFFDQQATLPTGIVGGFAALEKCTGFCAYSWESPDGRRGSYRTEGYVVQASSRGDAPFVFAGPAGDWAWQWRGLLTALRTPDPRIVSPVIYGAFAPVGDAWELFS